MVGAWTARFTAFALFLLLVGTPLGNAQDDSGRTDASAFFAREDLATAGEMDGAQRILRFVQVSDAHIIDDDAPYPLRQEPIDTFGSPFEGAARPHDEYTDEVLDSAIQTINALHAQDPFSFIINTGDNIDNALENELMRFIDNWEGTVTTVGPISGFTCKPDGAYAEDASNDVADSCTSLPEGLAADNTPLVDGLPWYSAFGNHDGLIQGNVPDEPTFREIAENQAGRYFLHQWEYVNMHFDGNDGCPEGVPGGSTEDDFGHGYANAGDRLCDEDLDNNGYYSFTENGVRFIVLDTVNDDFVTSNDNLAGSFTPEQQVGNDVMGGYSEGSLDAVQYAWLENELAESEEGGEAVILFSHHTVNSMFTDNVPNECEDGVGCLRDLLTESGFKTGNDMIELLSGHDNVVAWIGGHTHQHKIETKSAPGADHGFWNVETSALIDAPQEGRTVEIWSAENGTKGVLRLEPFGHDFQPSKDLVATDEQQNPSQLGEEKDQAVMLWFDVPEGVELVPGVQLPGTPPDFYGGGIIVSADDEIMVSPSALQEGNFTLNATGVYSISTTAENAAARQRFPQQDLDVEFRVINATGMPGDVIIVDDEWVPMAEIGYEPVRPDTDHLSIFSTDYDFYANGEYNIEVRYLSVDGETLATEQYTVVMADEGYEVDDTGAPALAMPFIAIGVLLAVIGARRT